MTGGPNNWAARVNYPPTGPQNSYVFFNYKDTVDVQWTSWAENSTETTMQIWWWAPTLGSGQWQPLQRDVVAQNGSKTYSLDNVKNQGAGYYLGQWNLNFTRADNSPSTGLTLSQAFNCSFDDSIQPRAFAQGLAPPTTPPAPQSSSTTQAATSTSGSVATVLITPSTTSNDFGAAAASTTAATGYVSSTSLSGGAIAGVIIAVIAALGLGAAGAFLLWRRAQHKKSMEAAGAAAGGGFPPHQPPPQYAQHPGQYQGYNPGYNQGFNQGLHPQGPVGYGGDYKQPLPQGTGHGEFYKPQVMMAEAPGHSFSELPAQSHRREFSRQELPG